jgi:hypothetical protein
MVMKETAIYLRQDKLCWLLRAARVVELEIATDRFQEMVSLQQRLRKTGYTELTDQEAELVADIWERLKKYVREQGPGYEHLITLVEE